MEDQEKSYEVNDKRRVSAEDAVSEEAVEQEEQITEETQQAEQADGGFPMPDIDVYMILGFTIRSLEEKAWETMGIRLAPGAKELKKDLVQAKLAVDTITFLVDKLNSQMDEDEKKAAKAMVSNLQINFVRHSS